MTDKKYLVVAALFKNESHIFKEWIEHYFYHGFEHIYLLNDKSTDNYMDIIEPYIKDNKITLYNVEEEYYRGRQISIYNKFLLPLVKDKRMKWLFICDLDEFLWSSRDVDIKKILKLCENYSQIQFDSNCFGSNQIEEQPNYVVPNFTKRAKLLDSGYRNFKYIINSDYEFT